MVTVRRKTPFKQKETSGRTSLREGWPSADWLEMRRGRQEKGHTVEESKI